MSIDQDRLVVAPRSRLPLRAIIEIVDSEMHVYPIADSDADELLILDALRFVREDFQG